MHGNVESSAKGYALNISITSAGRTRTERRDLPEAPVMTLNLSRVLASRGITPGASYQWSAHAFTDLAGNQSTGADGTSFGTPPPATPPAITRIEFLARRRHHVPVGGRSHDDGNERRLSLCHDVLHAGRPWGRTAAHP